MNLLKKYCKRSHVATAWFRKCMTVLIAAFMLCFAAPQSHASIELFGGNYSKTAWRSQQSPDTKPIPNLLAGRPGIKLMCPFSTVADRCYWDADISLNLAETTGFNFSIKLKDPKTVSGGTLYFHSGKGWYNGWFSIDKNTTSWQNIQISRRDFVADGKPDGWNTVDRVRVALWKESTKDTVVTLANLRGHSDEIIILYNNNISKTHPEEEAPIKRAVENISGWLKSSGISAGHFNYKDIVAGVPSGCKLIILPYNPYPAKSTIPALTKFTARGGRLIVAYSLPPDLAPLLGLGDKDWHKTGTDQLFSAISFKSVSSTGLPAIMRQNSWNAHIPEIKNAKVLGYWQNGSGQITDIPAMTINKNGIFIGHTLTRFDNENKIQFLLAAAAMLRPDMKAQLIKSILHRSERLLTYETWPTTRAFIKQTAIEQQQTKSKKQLTSQKLAAIDRYRGVTSSLMKTASSGELITRAVTTRKLIQQSYLTALSNNTSNEFRGIWCHESLGIQGMEWDEITKAMKANGFNALFPNMLWSGLAFYPSSIVPGPPASSPRQGNLLKKCLKACKNSDIELHLWKVCWNLSQASPAFVDKMRAEGRLQKKADGTTVQWLCPSDPRNRDIELSAAVEVARKYKVDGIHYDYIRYPDSESCYCEGCRKRFAKETTINTTNWPACVITGTHKIRFKKWRRDQITSFVMNSSKAIKSARKGIQFSVAVFGSWPSCRDSIGQDWVRWAKDGYVDFICPMNYVTDAAEAKKLITKQLLSAGTRTPIYPGLGPSTKNLPPEQVARQVDIIRKAGAKGFLLFEMDKDLLDIHLPALHSGTTAENEP